MKHKFKVGDLVKIKHPHGASWIEKGKIYLVHKVLSDGDPVFYNSDGTPIIYNGVPFTGSWASGENSYEILKNNNEINYEIY